MHLSGADWAGTHCQDVMQAAIGALLQTCTRRCHVSAALWDRHLQNTYKFHEIQSKTLLNGRLQLKSAG